MRAANCLSAQLFDAKAAATCEFFGKENEMQAEFSAHPAMLSKPVLFDNGSRSARS